MDSNQDHGKDALALRLSEVAAIAAEQERPASTVALELLGGEIPIGRSLEEKIEYVEEKLSAAQAAQVRADALGDRAHEMGGGIPGFGGSGNQRAAQQVRAAFGRADRAAREADERVAYWEQKLSAYKRRLAERDRVRFTHEDIKGATWVRVGYGWCKVARVNAKTVSVETGYSWTDRIVFDKVLEVRR